MNNDVHLQALIEKSLQLKPIQYKYPEHDIDMRWVAAYFTVDFSAVYTPWFLDMIRRSWFDCHDSRLPSSTVFYLEYPTGIKAHNLKVTLMIAWMFLL